MKQKTASALPQALRIICKKGKNTACTNSESESVKSYLSKKVKMSAWTILVSVVLSVVMTSFGTKMIWNYYNITLVVAIMCFMIHLLSKFLVRAHTNTPTANRRVNENAFMIKQPKHINKKSKKIIPSRNCKNCRNCSLLAAIDHYPPGMHLHDRSWTNCECGKDINS